MGAEKGRKDRKTAKKMNNFREKENKCEVAKVRRKADGEEQKGNVQVCSGVLMSGRVSRGGELTARRVVGRLALRETRSPPTVLGCPVQKGCWDSCSPISWKFQLFMALYLFLLWSSTHPEVNQVSRSSRDFSVGKMFPGTDIRKSGTGKTRACEGRWSW